MAAELRLGDGRTLAWNEYGDPAGRAVLALHGSPSSGLDFAPLEAAARRCSVRLVAPDRPGIGRSSPYPGRTLLGWAGDAVQLLDHLHIDRVVLLGFSGGGPYGLAFAHALPERTSAVIGVSAAGPVQRPGGRHGMSIDDRVLTTLSLRAPWLARMWMRVMVGGARAAPTLVVRGQAAALSPDASEVLSSLGPPRSVLAPFYEAARQGPAGPVEDFATISRAFGFDLGAVPGPVRLFHGTADRIVPLEHARFLADHIPGARLTEVPDAGHLLLYERPDLLLSAAAQTPTGPRSSDF